MKKLLSLAIAALLVFTMCVPAFAWQDRPSEITAPDPVVYVAGDSGDIAYQNGEKVFSLSDIGDMFSDSGKKNVLEAVVNVLQPFLFEGLVLNKWDRYYAALEKEIGELFSPIAMDENGNPKEGTGITADVLEELDASRHEDRAESDGGYLERSYMFYYDWRMDPMDVAVQLHDYIEDVKEATGRDQVNLSVRCLGCNVMLAYVTQYGTEDIHGVAIDVATSLGSEFLGGALTGDFGIDGNSISRFLRDLNVHSKAGIDEFVMASIELLAASGLTKLNMDILRKTLYEKIEKGVIFALGTSTMLTMPCYWGMVPYDQFDEAVTNVFGPEGSEKRVKYAGLIEKITRYNEEIKKNVLPIMQGVSDDGVNIAVISKYGTQLLPVLKDGSTLADFYVSTANSSFGATTSDVYSQLSDEYIAEREAQGLGKYISPDKQIDASTCLFPDFTWFFKCVHHGYYTKEETDIMMTVLAADTQLTIDDFDWTQYILFDYPTRTAVPMDENNSHDMAWTVDEETERPQTFLQKVRAYFVKLGLWYRAFFQMIKNRITKK